MQHLDVKQVCDGCWKRGVCVKSLANQPWTAGVCTCPCTTDGWLHTDDPRSKK